MDYEERGEEIRLEWKRLQAAVADKHQELIRLQEQIRKIRNVDVRLGPLAEAVLQLLPKE